MVDKITDQFSGYNKLFTNAITEANTVAIKNFEKAVNAQISAVHNQLDAVNKYVKTLSNVKSFEDTNTVWPAGLEFAKENLETLVSNGQEIVNIANETFVELGKLAKEQGEEVVKTTNKTTKKAA